jgi:hypothetical protein
MLHVETDGNGDQVFIHMDQAGVARLKTILETFEGRPESPEHDHLMSPSWGGGELEEKIDAAKKDSDHGANHTVHHVKLYFWPAGS